MASRNMEPSQPHRTPFAMPMSTQRTREDENQFQLSRILGPTGEEGNSNQMQYPPSGSPAILPVSSSLTYPYAYVPQDFEIKLERESAQFWALRNQTQGTEFQREEDRKNDREEMESSQERNKSQMKLQVKRLRGKLDKAESELERTKEDRDMIEKELEKVQRRFQNLQDQLEKAKEKADKQGEKNKKEKLEDNKDLQAVHEAEIENLKNEYETRIQELVEKVNFYNNGRLYLASLNNTLKKRLREHEGSPEAPQRQGKKSKAMRSPIFIQSNQPEPGPSQLELEPNRAISNRQKSLIPDPIPSSSQGFPSSYGSTLVSSQPSPSIKGPRPAVAVDNGPDNKFTFVLWDKRDYFA